MSRNPSEGLTQHYAAPRLHDSDGPHSGEGAASALATMKRRLELLTMGPGRPLARTPHADRRS
jgi:hypothetical protein